jgi:hypothetical protein
VVLTYSESGSSGSSGISGSSGTSGSSGVNGTSGSSGSSGVNGTSGSSGISPDASKYLAISGGTITGPFHVDIQATNYIDFKGNGADGYNFAALSLHDNTQQNWWTIAHTIDHDLSFVKYDGSYTFPFIIREGGISATNATIIDNGGANLTVKGTGDSYNYARVDLTHTATGKNWLVGHRQYNDTSFSGGTVNSLLIQHFDGTSYIDPIIFKPNGNIEYKYNLSGSTANISTIVTGNHSTSGSTAQVVNTIYGTSGTPPVGTYPTGTIYIKYTN